MGIVGLHHEVADRHKISGYIDISDFAYNYQISHYYVKSYGLKSDEDKELLLSLDYNLVWVAGWQRLVPGWLISKSPLGVLGGHGSPDGIHGGRGRSPQNWALLLGAKRFDLALFKISPGVDDGPIIMQRSFFYNESDDINISYYKASIAMAEMICAVLERPGLLEEGTPQSKEAFYYPQRCPNDGFVDWHMGQKTITRHSRALTDPYPGLKTKINDVVITIWECVEFDEEIVHEPGVICFCFSSGDFLVSCLDGRVLVCDWSADGSSWEPEVGLRLESLPFRQQMEQIVERHCQNHPDQPISPRIQRHV